MENNSGRYCVKTTTDANTVTPSTTQTSAADTPSTLPNSTASGFCPGAPNSWINARPRANEAVVITPMAASDPIDRRRVTRLISSAEARPHNPAPTNRLIPIRLLAANPPKMACDKPCPM